MRECSCALRRGDVQYCYELYQWLGFDGMFDVGVLTESIGVRFGVLM